MGIVSSLFGGKKKKNEKWDITTTGEPWGPIAGSMRDAIGDMGDLYREGGPEYYPFDTFLPYSPATMYGLESMWNRSGGSPYEDMMGNTLGNMMQDPGGGFQQGYLQNQMMQGPQYFGGQMPGQSQDIFNQAIYNNPLSQYGQQDPRGFAGQGINTGQAGGMGKDLLGSTLGGDFLSPESNPYLKSTYEAASRPVLDAWKDEIMPSISSSFAAAGGTSVPGGIENEMKLDSAEKLGRVLGDISSGIYGNAYESERGRQQGALGIADTSDIARLGLGSRDDLARLGLGATIRGQDIGAQGRAMDQGLMAGSEYASDDLRRRLMNQDAYQFQENLGQRGAGYLTDLDNMRNQWRYNAAGMVPELSGLEWNNIQNQLNVGNAFDQKAYEQLGDMRNRFDYYEGRPYNMMNQWINQMAGLPIPAHAGTINEQGQRKTTETDGKGLLSKIAAGASLIGGLPGAFGGMMGNLGMGGFGAPQGVNVAGGYTGPRYGSFGGA